MWGVVSMGADTTEPTFTEAIEEIPERFLRLVPGRRYRVTLDDCCIEGHFDAVFVKVHLTREADGTPFCQGLIFDTAVIGPNWGSFEAFEINA